MADLINTILADYDAEFDLNSQSSQLSSISQVMETPKLSNPLNNKQITNKAPKRSEQTSKLAINQHKNTIEHQEIENNELYHLQHGIQMQQNAPPKQDLNMQLKVNAQQMPPPEPSQSSPVLDNIKFEVNNPPVTAKTTKITAEQASHIISDLRKERIQDAEKMQKLQTDNARLQARIAILEHTDLKVAELGSKVEQLLTKYLEADQERNQLLSLTAQMKQEIMVLKFQTRYEPQSPQVH